MEGIKVLIIVIFKIVVVLVNVDNLFFKVVISLIFCLYFNGNNVVCLNNKMIFVMI